jgi:HTH-type transcriptional regulator/antitoxin HipB
MSDLNRCIRKRKKSDRKFAEDYEEDYEQFKVGVMLREARLAAGMTQEELARRIGTKKTAISRIENHAEDVKLSTLKKTASALGKKLEIKIA